MTSPVTVQPGPPQLKISVSPLVAILGQPASVLVQTTISLGLVPQGNVVCATPQQSTPQAPLTSNGSAQVDVSSLLHAGSNALTCTFTSDVNSDSASASTTAMAAISGFSAGPALINARENHTATKLNDGTVLIAGGQGAGTYTGVPVAAAELLCSWKYLLHPSRLDGTYPAIFTLQLC